MLNHTIKFLIGLLFLLQIGGCNGYLDKKPDSALAIPNSLKDLQAMLDYELYMNNNYPAAGDIAADYYYLSDADWSSRQQRHRDTYVWDAQVDVFDDWQAGYTTIFYANVVLDHVGQAVLNGLTETDRARIQGEAYFFRGWTYYQLAQIYTTPYDPVHVSDPTIKGLPLRLKSDINEVSVRASLKDTYQQIVNDLELAATLLPDKPLVPTRPSKAAAYGALARVYLIMGEYDQSLTFGEKCLEIQSDLMNYNTLRLQAANPFDLFNNEVIFHAKIANGSGVHASTRAKVNMDWYAQYEENDLRKSAYFTGNQDGTYAFKGHYDGNVFGNVFSGITTSEIYLTVAESARRLGNVGVAQSYLNTLLRNRYVAGKFTARTEDDMSLRHILLERRRELVFRGGIRWPDLRRLNLDDTFADTLTRNVNSAVYNLLPRDVRYTFLIPNSVILEAGLEQNSR